MRTRALARRRADQGFALTTTLLAGLLLSLFLVISLAYVLQGVQSGRLDQDGKVALAAAQAGVEDYLSRLNADGDYWQRGNDDTGNAALTAADGRAVQGTGGVAGRYRYTVLSSVDETARTGAVRLAVTGTSTPGPGHAVASRTLTATLKPRTFLDFAYLSDIEVMDPALVGSDPGCANYAYGASSRAGLDCPAIIWKSGDSVNGPLHSNDALTIDSPAYFGDPKTESSWPYLQTVGPADRTWLGSAASVGGNEPHFALPLTLPEGNGSLTDYVEPDVNGDGKTGPGCYYTGATRIVLHGATMSVLSPSTTRIDTPSRCLNAGAPGTWQVKPIPPVIYVDSTSGTCTNGAVGYPAAGEAVPTGGADDSAWGHTTNADCHRGTVYVEGMADTQVTIAGKDDVVVTDDLTTAGHQNGQNVIGLVAGNDVWVRHPVDSTGANLAGAPVVHTIEAAVLSLRHSFVVQNWDSGAALGSLQVTGSLGQRLRGPVGATDDDTGAQSGYLKDYRYDRRFTSIQPPYFLRPAANLWHVVDVTDR